MSDPLDVPQMLACNASLLCSACQAGWEADSLETSWDFTESTYGILQCKVHHHLPQVPLIVTVSYGLEPVSGQCRPAARSVAQRVVMLSLGLGVTTGALMAAASGILPRLFTADAGVLSAVAIIFPW